jgi:phosphonate transport system permease protein
VETLSLSKALLPPPRPAAFRRNLVRIGLIALALAALAWSWTGTEMSLRELVRSGPHLAEFLDRMLPPDFGWRTDDARPFPPPLRLALGAIGVTLQIALLGTALGAGAAFVLGALAAENLTPHWVHHPIKMLLAVVRSLPVILLALLFVAAVGLGPFPGVLAVAIHSLGMLGKIYAEECETVGSGVLEALDSTGASWLQKIRYAVWPQVAAQVWSQTLLRFEMNLRESAVLGLVGVAGLGLWIENYRRAFLYTGVATLVLVTMALVLLVDQLGFHIRRRLK